MLIARLFVVSGRVQGVGFRWFVQELAAVENARGWVRNRPDGSVEALVQGERDSVERIERRIRRGPPAARVERVEVTDVAVDDRLSSFGIAS
jgi:acylphosphatase